MTATVEPLQAEIHATTWRFMRGIHRRWYGPRPELSLIDWLCDMRLARGALFGEDLRIDLMLAESIGILEHVIVAHGGRLPPELT